MEVFPTVQPSRIALSVCLLAWHNTLYSGMLGNFIMSSLDRSFPYYTALMKPDAPSESSFSQVITDRSDTSTSGSSDLSCSPATRPKLSTSRSRWSTLSLRIPRLGRSNYHERSFLPLGQIACPEDMDV
ncbi:hypothetical protein QBC37DRAFT_418442 [Rhypophila decipiens]|uniref:Uncharacterized protein n=1 Tax=Rhypophila decipiens TaxID=261697 RepID=A0AAN6YBB2_9PEZI|nr:hypothetical protein QBC37DRAFT_418442 [Rhypophila decipiens]